MNAPLEPDDWMDEMLRRVAAPGNLVARLRRIAAPTDAEIDARLAAVPPPPRFVENLLVVAGESDAELDAALRDVEPPTDLLPRLRAIARRRPTAWGALSAAACLWLAVGISYLGAMGAFVWSVYHPLSRPTPVIFIADIAVPRATINDERLLPIVFESPAFVAQVSEPQRELVPQDAWLAKLQASLEADLAVVRRSYESRYGDSAPLAALAMPALVTQVCSLASTPLLTLADAAVNEGLLDLSGRQPPRRPVIASSGAGSGGVSAVRVSPVDGAVFSTTDQPEIVAPLTGRATSYGLLRDAIARRQWPERSTLRAEELLAVAAEVLPSASDNRMVNLTLAAGPAPTTGAVAGNPATWMIQLGARVRELPPAGHRPRHVIVALDCSDNMRWLDRAAMARRALASLPRWLNENDRLSLVRFSDVAEPLLVDIAARDADGWRQALETVRPEGPRNVAAALVAAATIHAAPQVDASGASKPLPRHVILITDSTARVSPEAWSLAHRAWQLPQCRDAQLHVIQVAPGHDSQPRPVPAIGRTAEVSVHSAASEAELRWALAECVAGRWPLAGEAPRWSITFNPRWVSGYRLIGHEPTVVAGSSAERVAGALYSGEAVTALYEIQLTPEARRADPAVFARQELARAAFTWRDPRTGDERRATARLLARDLPGSFAETPAATQFALMAACAADALRAPSNGESGTGEMPLAAVLNWRAQVRPELSADPRFQEFIEVLAALESLRPERSRPEKRGP